MMKAALLTGHGGNEVVCLGERPIPLRRPGEVLVRVRAASLNRVDLYMRNSGAGITHTLPQIMGLDAAGVVVEADRGSEPLIGMPVVVYPVFGCGSCEFCHRGEVVLCTHIRYMGEHCDGTIAEFVSVPARNVFPLPEGLGFEEGACLGVNYLTAWRMLFTKARLRAAETVLIFGIGGGVSLAALQLAKSAGARTIVTSRDDVKLRRALAMGADHAVNGSIQDISKEVLGLTGGRGVDVVIENVGSAVWSHAMRSVVRGGRIVTCGATSGDQPPADLRRVFIRQLQILGSTMGDPEEMAEVLNVVERKRLHPQIDSVWPVESIHQALDRLESGEHFGKVVVSLAGEFGG